MGESFKTDDGVKLTVNGISIFITGPSNLLGRLCTKAHMARLASAALPTRCIALWTGNGARTIEVKATVGGNATDFKDNVIGWLKAEGIRLPERHT